MKLAFNGDPTVIKILGKHKIISGKSYRWSDFVYLFEHNNLNYAFNNLTKKCYDISSEKIIADKSARFTYDDICNVEKLSTLAADYFLVPEDKDEPKAYENTLKILRALARTKGYKGYTILPTTACNARCVYCYEKGIKYVTMSDETVEQTIKFIKNSSDKTKKISLMWFGGEPLVGEKIIDRIVKAVRDEGINYKSTMITNGSLITEEIVDKMVNDWKLEHVQITLDGTEEEYNTRKNYVFNYPSAYWHVLGRIAMVNRAEIKTTIRVNVDENNIESVITMLDDLSSVIEKPEFICVNIIPLFDIQSNPEGISVWERTFELAGEVEKRGFRSASRGSVNKLRNSYCMAMSPRAHIVINPEGELYNCENFREFDCIGTVWDGVINTAKIKELDMVEPAREMCKGCVSLPTCTTFTKCVHTNASCRYTTVKRMDMSLRKKLDNIQSEETEDDELLSDN